MTNEMLAKLRMECIQIAFERNTDSRIEHLLNEANIIYNYVMTGTINS